MTKVLSPGQMTAVESGGKNILVANIKGEHFAIGNVCTHRGCKLSNGTLTGDNVVCPCHGSTFNVKTGAVVKGPAQNPEPAYKVKIEGDSLTVLT